ncbi:hypothetical protein FIA58_004060 [Flavobacterium jejuense]|uniref:Uncharacterized protein n=1 Tax=Flavobacterium jejuense TaxID=1544455 RepID=A0ABX0IPX1_9FLAO|nr:hypothetical protein [Flavobacterium jejuense]NHN24844.1 hypothetical protein [Flavobacterium jejuense]
MKKISTLLLILVTISFANAQEITGFKTETFFNEYGNFRLKITPNTFDATKSKITKTKGVYGIRICYTQNGAKKAVLRDMTSKIVTNAEFIYGEWGSGKGIKVTDITFFRADKITKEQWPSKSDCL